MKNLIFIFILSLLTPSVNSQITMDLCQSIQQTLPYYGCFGRSGNKYIQTNINSINKSVNTKFDLSEKELSNQNFYAYASWRISNNIYLVAISIEDYRPCYRTDYLVTVNNEGKIIDYITAFASLISYQLSPLQFKICSDKKIIIRQAVITDVIEECIEVNLNEYIPSVFNMRYVDKEYSIGLNGNFIFEENRIYGINKSTWEEACSKTFIKDCL